MKHRVPATLLLVLMSVLVGCGNDQPDTPQSVDAREVFASNYPMAYFCERLLGSADQVNFPSIDGDPAFWIPSREQILLAQSAKVIVFNGATYEKWADKVSLHADRIVRSAGTFRSDWIEVKKVTSHSHGPESKHSHAGTAFTTWLDFSQAAQQLAAVRDKLVAAKLGTEADIHKRHDELASELKALDDELLALTKNGRNIPLVASHPVYQYLARRYRLRVRAVHWEPESDPGEIGWMALDETLLGYPAKWMIWEGDPLPATVAKLEKRGIRSVVFDPCGNRPDDGDFLSVMRANIANLRPIFGK